MAPLFATVSPNTCAAQVPLDLRHTQGVSDERFAHAPIMVTSNGAALTRWPDVLRFSSDSTQVLEASLIYPE